MAESPFVATSDRLGALVRALDPRAQALLFCSAARALLAERTAPVEDALAAAHDFAVGGRVSDAIPQLLAGLNELQVRLDETNVLIHDALICADIALQIPHAGFDASDGVWYMLEPQFQATSQRLFGFTEVGSEREERDEAIALQDPVLARAVGAVEAAVAELTAEPSEADAAAVLAALVALRP